jgi:hypothetical protein
MLLDMDLSIRRPFAGVKSSLAHLDLGDHIPQNFENRASLNQLPVAGNVQGLGNLFIRALQCQIIDKKTLEGV